MWAFETFPSFFSELWFSPAHVFRLSEHVVLCFHLLFSDSTETTELHAYNLVVCEMEFPDKDSKKKLYLYILILDQI